MVIKTDVIVPPWELAPDMDPEDPDSHGPGEAYVLINWLRFWQLLRPEEQEIYFDDWNASPAWRKAIRERYDHYQIEIDRDAIRALREMRGEKTAESPWWRRFW